MKKFFLLLMTLGFGCGLMAQPQYSVDECVELYLDEQFEQIVPSLRAFDTNGKVYKKNSFRINYMLGTCLCKTGNPGGGRKVLEWMKKCYDLNSNHLRVFNKDISVCGSNMSSRNNYLAGLPYNRNSNAGTRTKVYRPKEIRDSTIMSSPTQLIDSSLFRIYPTRLIKKSAVVSENILQELKISPTYIDKYTVTDNFIVFGDKRKQQNTLEAIGKQLEKTCTFFKDYYGLDLPEHYINVFVLNSFERVDRFASQYHKLDLERKTIGYAFEPDFSISGYIPFSAAGTLKHELLHLLLHFNYQAIPPWVDEGLAALYEVSRFTGSGDLLGKNNWRGQVLSNNWDYFTYDEDVQLHTIMSTFDWQKANRSYNAGMVYALSRYFFLYLQEKGMLRDYFYRVMSYSPESDDGFFVKELEKVYKANFNELEKNFYVWLEDRVKH